MAHKTSALTTELKERFIKLVCHFGSAETKNCSSLHQKAAQEIQVEKKENMCTCKRGAKFHPEGKSFSGETPSLPDNFSRKLVCKTGTTSGSATGGPTNGRVNG